MNRGLYFWVGTRELLPAAWRWYSACVQEATSTNDDALTYLGGSLLQRVQRALQARDDVHLALNRPQGNDAADAALSSLDVCLVFLMGAVDVAARIAHRTLRLTGNVHNASWQREKWINAVAKQDASLAATVQTGASGSHTLTILRLLRNSVHGEALPSLAVQRGGTRHDTLVGLPQAVLSELLGAIDALGGQAMWSVQGAIPGRMHCDPGILLEQLFPRVLELLNTLMERTPVERLPHVTLQPAHSLPPSEEPWETFGEYSRHSIRWQLGL
jgi:hypothetical protein